jgi:serine/threonine protein kinase
MAPEILLGQSYSSKSDLWSVGCIYFEMLFGRTPLNPMSMDHLKRMASEHSKILIPSTVSLPCVSLLVRLVLLLSLSLGWSVAEKCSA